MKVGVEHRVKPASWTVAMSRQWTSFCPTSTAQQVVSQLWEIGQALPMASFLGSRVFPVVVWSEEALARRAEVSCRPVLNPKAVQHVLADPECAAVTPAVLRIVGFVGLSPLRTVRRELAGLRAVARTVALVPPGARPRALTLAEFDAQGTTVAVPEGRGANVIVGGDPGPREGSAMSPIWLRF